MNGSSFVLFEPARVFLSSQPPTFIVEVVLRLCVLYGTLVLAMRLMGRRMSSQLTRNELLALVTLAGATGSALQDPTRGLLPPVVATVLIVVVQREYARLTLRSERVERFFHGDPDALVTDGRLALDALRRNAISRQRMFAELRSSGITQLGAIERVYIEPSGAFTILKRPEPTSGLSLIPDWDADMRADQQPDERTHACLECGATLEARDAPRDRACAHCGGRRWTRAIAA